MFNTRLSPLVPAISLRPSFILKLRAGLSAPYQKIEDTLASHFSTRVKLKHSRNGSGQILIDYYSQEELNKLLALMEVKIG